jgi:hypothetical protein
MRNSKIEKNFTIIWYEKVVFKSNKESELATELKEMSKV